MIIRVKINTVTDVITPWSIFEVEGSSTFDNIMKDIFSGMIYLVYLFIYTYELCVLSELNLFHL